MTPFYEGQRVRHWQYRWKGTVIAVGSRDVKRCLIQCDNGHKTWAEEHDLSLVENEKARGTSEIPVTALSTDELLNTKRVEYGVKYTHILLRPDALGEIRRRLREWEGERTVSDDLIAELSGACELALNAFEHNWAIDWNVLSDAVAKARLSAHSDLATGDHERDSGSHGK